MTKHVYLFGMHAINPAFLFFAGNFGTVFCDQAYWVSIPFILQYSILMSHLHIFGTCSSASLWLSASSQFAFFCGNTLFATLHIHHQRLSGSCTVSERCSSEDSSIICLHVYRAIQLVHQRILLYTYVFRTATCCAVCLWGL